MKSVLVLSLAAALLGGGACTDRSDAVDPNPGWRPANDVWEIFSELQISRKNRPIESRDPPFDRGAWSFEGLGGMSSDWTPGLWAYFLPIEDPVQSRLDEIITLAPRCLGDLGDIYRRITGTEHPMLRGERSRFHVRSLEWN